MEILVVNPNTTASMTDKIRRAAEGAAAPGTRIIAVNPALGPESIEGFYDEALAVPGLLEEIAKGEAQWRGRARHCLLRRHRSRRCSRPGPRAGGGDRRGGLSRGQPGGRPFSVVTTLGRAIPAIEFNLIKYGLASRCARVRAAEIPVLALEARDGSASRLIDGEIEAALRDDRAEAIVLGCAGMVDLAADLAARHGVPVIDGVTAAVTLVEALARLGLATSKRGGYAPPLPKRVTGFSIPPR